MNPMMNGINPANNVGPAMTAMKNGANGATPRPVSDADRDTEYKTKLNTYVYDYFLRNDQYEVARAMINSKMPLLTKNRRQNGMDENSMDADTKDDLEAMKQHDLPFPDQIGDASSDNSFLLDWFSLFWDIFFSPRNRGAKNPHAVQYMDHSRVSQIYF